MNGTIRFAVGAIVICDGHFHVLATEFIPLGFLSADATDRSSGANGVDAHGTTVVGRAYANGQQYGFIWRSGAGMQPLDVADHVTSANAISDDGTVIVGETGTSSSILTQAFLLRNGNDFRTMAASAGISGATDVSADGSVAIVSTYRSFQYQPYRWTEQSGFERFGNPTANPRANSISSDGQVIVGQASNQAVRWDSDGSMTGIGFLPNGDYSAAYGVSANGDVIVGQGYIGTVNEYTSAEAFRWDKSTGVVGLGFLPDTYPQSVATQVSNDGNTILGFSGVVGKLVDYETFVWDPQHGMRSLLNVLLDDPSVADSVRNWHFEYPGDISADGRTIVGTGIDPLGHEEAFLIRFDSPIGVPEPQAIFALRICADYLR